MKLVIVVVNFMFDEVNELCKVMVMFCNVGMIGNFYVKMVDGMVVCGYEVVFVECCFKQIEGFGLYGFFESYVFSFVWLVYVLLWIKCFQFVVFCCVLLNLQLMGFYVLVQLVCDVVEYGVCVLLVDVNVSGWDNVFEFVKDL